MNENHIRVLSTALAVVEQNLEKIRHVILKEPEHSGLLKYDDDVPPAKVRSVLQLIEKEEEEIRRFKESLHLDMKVISKAREIDSLVSLTSTIVEDLRPEKISKSYGKMNEADQERIRPQIMKMLDILYGMKKTVQS